MLIISVDAVGDDEFPHLMKYPTFSAFSEKAAVYRDVSTVFISNTYPIHASIVTGVKPCVHGIISNTEIFPTKSGIWNAREDGFRVKTIWQAAVESGFVTTAVFWPVTAYSKSIRYNIPEVLAQPGKNQIVTSMKAGSTLLQIVMFLRHRKLLKGIDQPDRDRFATACMADILRKHKPGLALMHLTAYDSLCHKLGKGAEALEPVFRSLDENLSILLDAAGHDRDVLILSDHGQQNVHTSIEPNGILVEAGLLRRQDDVYMPGEYGCFIECGGGSAFFRAGKLPEQDTEKLRAVIEISEGFRRFLTDEEMQDSGHEDAAFGFCAKPGYCYEPIISGKKAEHGYPLDTPDYKVFYMAKGFGLPPGSVTHGASLLDIAPLVAKRLGLNMHNE